MEGLKDRVFLAGLHGSLLFVEVIRQIFFLISCQPADLVRTIFDAEEEESSEGQCRDGFKDEEFLPAVQAKEGAFEQHAGNRGADDI